MNLLIPAAVLGIIGIVFAIILGIAADKFYVPVDPKVQAIGELLPGANCGACGYPGCDNLAESLASGMAPIDACPIGGAELAEDLAELLGGEAGEFEKEVAVVMCQGDREVAEDKYEYIGISDCRAIALEQGGNKECLYGCLGGGTCQDVCDFGAVQMVNGLAVIDKDKCTACLKCVDVCPKSIIKMVPYDQEYQVLCNSKDKGGLVRKYCTKGCIGCNICVKQYPEGFEIKDFLAKSSYNPDNYDEEALANAVEKCPNDCIRKNVDVNLQVKKKEKVGV